MVPKTAITWSFVLIGMVMGVVISALLPALSEAGIKSVQVGTTSWDPDSETRRTPLFRNGNNTIVVVGEDIGLMTAERFVIHENCIPYGVNAGGRIIAVGSIKERTTQPGTLPTGKLVLSLPLTPAHPVGNFCGHLTYPAGNLSRDVFTVQIFHRGNVQAIAVFESGRAVTQVASGEPVRIRFTGSFFGRTFSSNIIPIPYILDRVIQNIGTLFEAEVRFTNCGPVTLFPQLIFDRAAPVSVLTEDSKKRFQGGARLPIQVIAGTNGCPRTQTYRPSPSRQDADPTCGDPGQPACATGPAVTR